MTPEEQQIISYYATVIQINTVAYIMVLATGFGATVLGILIATRILTTKPWSHSRVALFACLIITFIALTWNASANVAFPLIQGKVELFKIKPDVQGAVEAKAQITNRKLLPFTYMNSWDLTLSIYLSDFIVVWRAWALFQQQKLWKVALVLLMITNFGVQIADGILDDIEIKVPEESNPSTILDWLSPVVSLVVNMFATGLIAWKAWNHYHIVKDAGLHRRTRVQNVLLLLIESGAIYCTIQTVYAVSILLDVYGPLDSLRFAEYKAIIDSTFSLASAWYPMVVAVLVNMDNSPLIESIQINQTTEDFHRESQVPTRTVDPSIGSTH
ncbi:hypothetical protein GYMLUDRAFT_247762 [Collybiopsis luxurians FD-317 M1]|uniref:Uncharacterized protein n=1 Tax=Collybiopsis luxurians FD-317 M1 TaxID=944289 RepID=A0A0D0C2L8_9AGAR|nr:hypothetical protein GYMLUDRAFT_247762 [Collybiopsis luxurians FD-317 M1]